MAEIVDNWTDSVDRAAFYTVRISEHRYVDVKVCASGYTYIMDCEDGNQIYDEMRNTYPGDIPGSAEILQKVKEYHGCTMNEKLTLK